MSDTTSFTNQTLEECPACGAVMPRPRPRRCPACDAALGGSDVARKPASDRASRQRSRRSYAADDATGDDARDDDNSDATVSTPDIDSPASVTVDLGATPSVSYEPDDESEPATPMATPSAIGPKASLSSLGLEGGVTLEPGKDTTRIDPLTGTAATVLDGGTRKRGGTTRIAAKAGGTVGELLSQRPGEEKYVVAGEIARGGMGAILRSVDRDVRRDVAMKLLINEAKGRARERFVEEAQITGQLEHPNIVPVHDLGVDAEGRLFFTMKLVHGRSLAELLDEMRTPQVARRIQEDPQTADAYGLQRLLTIFVAVLDAMAFAHDRGVIHRDLKPGNVMVGDFNEVLVMDWGLAKVLKHEGATRQWSKQQVRTASLGQLAAGKGKGRSPVVMPQPGRTLATDEHLKTLVEGFATADGEIEGKAIEGTPAYMAPEQARGDLADIDERSDIYSLGAILYELLTLSPPVRRRNLRAILADVVAGRILAPEQRAPERVIPPELSAIAMKALATAKDDRYQAVLELRRDIQLYREDRQVSAKEDSTWETVVKLVRRNKQVVTAIAISVLIVVGVTVAMFSAIINERHRYQRSATTAEQRLQELRQEQERRASDQRRAAPALVAKARTALDQREFAEARSDVALAIDYDANLAEAHLLAGQIAIRDQAWEAAATALRAYLSLRTDDVDARSLKEMVENAAASPRPAASESGSSARLTAMADILVRQGAFTVAESLYQSGRDLVLLYRVRLEKQWPGSTRSGFSADTDGKLTIDGLAGRGDVTDLTPLAGMPISRLSLAGTKVFDLAPLKDMPLTHLDLTDTPVRSLDPLTGAPLTQLIAPGTRIDDLVPLIGSKLDVLDISDTPVADLAPLERLPLTSLKASRSRIADVVPLTGLPLTTLAVSGTRISDLTPLSGAKLTALAAANTRINDIQVLIGMPLTNLDLAGTSITDLLPLTGMPLTTLDVRSTPIKEIQPLSGMKLSILVLAGTRVTDLTPLTGMPLTILDLTGTPVSELAPLQDVPLSSLALDGTDITELKALATMPLKELRLGGTRVKDLRPLSDDDGPAKTLERLILPTRPEKGLTELRRLANLKQIGIQWDGTWAKTPQAAEFWKKRDEMERR